MKNMESEEKIGKTSNFNEYSVEIVFELSKAQIMNYAKDFIVFLKKANLLQICRYFSQSILGSRNATWFVSWWQLKCLNLFRSNFNYFLEAPVSFTQVVKRRMERISTTIKLLNKWDMMLSQAFWTFDNNNVPHWMNRAVCINLICLTPSLKKWWQSQLFWHFGNKFTIPIACIHVQVIFSKWFFFYMFSHRVFTWFESREGKNMQTMKMQKNYRNSCERWAHQMNWSGNVSADRE